VAEMVIVLAIIALLAAILVPSLRQVCAVARQTVCKTHLHAQAVAHATYGVGNCGHKPPLLVAGRRTLRVDWVSPRIKWSAKPVGQGILVATGCLALGGLYCPSASMHRDRELDRAAWDHLRDAGSSYAYFWRDPSCVRDPSAPAAGATYLEAVYTDRTALGIDINCQAGHQYTGDYEGRSWPSHPAVGKVNVSYIDGSARSYDNMKVRLAYPGGEFEESEWFDLAHRMGKEAPPERCAGRRTVGQ